MENLLNGLQQAAAFRQRNRRPMVSLCYAQSLDGSIAVQRGETTVISGSESCRLTHILRAKHDAILVGVGTIIADNPRLTVRHAEGTDPQPIILDSYLRIPLNSYVIQHHPLSPMIATTNKASAEKLKTLQKVNAKILVFPTSDSGRVDLRALLEHLAQKGINSIMVEGGARVLTSFLSMESVDQVVITIAPVFVGGLPALEDFSIQRQEKSKQLQNRWPRLKDAGSKWIGNDLIVWGRLG
jgi:3,4-dihydroxy 2-butanone 4-phosphate synthase/GTP cyclohydrolase II